MVRSLELPNAASVGMSSISTCESLKRSLNDDDDTDSHNSSIVKPKNIKEDTNEILIEELRCQSLDDQSQQKPDNDEEITSLSQIELKDMHGSMEPLSLNEASTHTLLAPENDFFYYDTSSGDYIAIDKTLELRNDNTAPNTDQGQELTTLQPDDEGSHVAACSLLSAVLLPEECYVCHICAASIGTKLISFPEYEKHVENCDGVKLVCCFCFRLFDEATEAEYEQHVAEHCTN